MNPRFLASTLLSLSRVVSATSSSTCPAVARTTLRPTGNLLKTCSAIHNPQQSSSFSTSSPSSSSQRNTTTTTTTTKDMSATLLEAFKGRRSIYQLTKDLPIPKEKITSIVQEALIQVPSSFNSQSNRLVVLYGAEHDKLWDIATSTLKAIVPADQWESTAGRMAGFKGAAGTVLCYVDQPTVAGMQEKFTAYKDRFPTWGEHSIAMLQFALWTTLEAEGLGANLQHYNPLIDAQVAKEWGIPETWTLTAQLVFGGKGAEAGNKEHKPLSETFKVFGA
ncbi:Nitroreductase-like protein [Xylariaceae sp. FL0255]|nr:Nitroreductase-like protein [Xylariaceae sp. FL0255]